MPALGQNHDTVRHALERDGWRITHDPYYVGIAKRCAYLEHEGYFELQNVDSTQINLQIACSSRLECIHLTNAAYRATIFTISA